MLGVWEITFDNLMRIATVIVSLGVVSAPILYPRHSLFVRRALDGQATLKKERKRDGDIRIGYLQEGERGF